MTAERLPELQGRSGEYAMLDRLLANVRGGQSAVLVIRGEAGVGKTALLRHAVERASGFRVAQIAGVESEIELPYAGLHQLYAPMLDRLDVLPEPQRVALGVALGVAPDDPPDCFLVALATRRCSCGGRPSASGSLRRPRCRRSRRSCSRSVPRSASTIRRCARRRTGRRRHPSAATSTRRWPTPPTPTRIPTGGRGTVPRRPPAPDEAVAEALEQSAARAQARGGVAWHLKKVFVKLGHHLAQGAAGRAPRAWSGRGDR